MLLTGILGMAASAVLAACGGTSATATIAPASPTTAANSTPVASAAVSGGQQGVTPTTVPAASARATATQPVPTAAAPKATAGSVASKVDPCTLVTKADYLAVMGDAANDPEKKDRPAGATSGISQSSCDYKIAAGGKVQFVTVNVTQRDASASTGVDLKTYWEGTKKAWATMQAKVTPLPEIGPEAYLVVNPLLEQIGAAGSVHVFKGDVIFDVQAVTGSGTVAEQNASGTVAAEKLAKIAFGRL